MNNRRFMLVPAWLFIIAALPAAELRRFEFTEPHMGTTARIVLYAPDEATAKRASTVAFARVAELNRIMSDYDPTSELMRLCAAEAGKPVKVSPELFSVLSHAQKIAKRSSGAFDVTIGPLVQLWRQSRLTQKLPSEDELKAAKAKVGYDKIDLNEQNRTVTLNVPGMKLDLGGIAKGYAADEMLRTLKKQGITRALASLGGDIVVGDAPPDSPGWKVDVTPLLRARPSHRLLLKNAAVSTSGDREQFTLINGVRYSHIVDPRTGLGQTGRRSVTVIAPHGLICDPMTKAMALLEPEQALKMIEEVPEAAALIIVKKDDGEETRESERLAQYLQLVP